MSALKVDEAAPVDEAAREARELALIAQNVKNPEVSKAMLDAVLRLKKDEGDRLAKADARATQLFTLSGLASALSASMVAPGFSKWVFLVALLCGVVCSVFAFRAIRVREAETGTAQDTIFGADYLLNPSDDADKHYRGLLAQDALNVAKELRKLTKEKSDLVTKGQKVAIGGLVVMTIGVAIRIVLECLHGA